MTIVEAPVQSPVTTISDADTEPDKLAHIVVPASKVNEGYILGVPVTALCGYSFVPTRDPHTKEKCRPCCDELDKIMEAAGRI